MPGKEYGWIRYCSEHGSGFDANSRGWLEVGETLLIGSSLGERLDRLGDVPCLILLGEPGEGKTKELERLASPEKPIRLEAYSDEERLRDDLRRALSQAEHGNERVWLFLDSLDEVLLPIRTAADVLFGELERIRPYLGAVRLRLTCRTGAWPATLEARLRSLWEGPEDVIRRTLLPLSRADVEKAALYEGFNAEALVREIERADIVPLASRPATLLMLFELYRQNERFPSSRWELYDQATRQLVTEPLERDERSTAGVLHPTEHRAVAALIATTMVLGNYVEVSRRIGVAGQGELDPKLVCILEDLEDGRRLQVNEDTVKEVLRGGLFAGTGSTRRFGHRTFGEFLCAWRLARQSVPLERILDLLRAGDTLVRPQLHELAGWIAARRRDVWAWLAEHEPSVLLLGDTATASPADRAELTEALLSLCHQRRLADYVGGWDEHLERLEHPELPQQLTKWVTRNPDGTAKDVVARRVAFRIALECAWWRLLPASQFPSSEVIRWRPFAQAALSVALDPNEEQQLRKSAVRAVDAFGDLGLVRSMSPLLDLPRTQDPDLDIRGQTLRALWARRAIPAEQVFQHLKHPPTSGYFGAYWFFIETQLVPGLRDDELPLALDWIARDNSAKPHLSSSMRRALMERAWQAADNPAIQKALISAIVALLASHQSLSLSSHLVRGDQLRRRRILLTLIRTVAKKSDLHKLSRQSLMESADLPWLLDMYWEETEESFRERLRLLIGLVLDLNNPAHCSLILDACTEDPLLANELQLLEPVRLDDPHIINQRQLAKREQKRRAQKKVRTAEEVVNERLRQPDADAWWGLWHALALEHDTDKPAQPWNSEVTELPGWKADPSRQSQIREVAKRYLRTQDPQTAEWLGTDHFNAIVLAGIAAVQVVATDSKQLSALDLAVWRRWTPALVAHGDKIPDTVRTEVCRQIPEVVAETIRAILGGNETSDGKAFAIERSANWWCQPLEAVILPLASEPQEEVIDRAILDVLAKGNPSTLTTIAWTRLDQRGMATNLRAHAAAALYQQHEGLDARRWWTALQADETLAHKVLALISKHNSQNILKQQTALPAEVLESIYLWLMERYPPNQDPGIGGGARYLGTRDHIASFRDKLVEVLGSRATSEDLAALQRLEELYPDRLRWTLAKARMQHRAKGWHGWTPAEIQAHLNGMASSPHQPTSAPLKFSHKETGMISIDDLFPERGFPNYTYVPLPQDAAIRRALTEKYKALLVEGPAATGKTQAVQYALKELKIPKDQRHEFRCADPADRNRLRRILDQGLRTLTGFLVVDDVHRIDDTQLLKDLIGAVKTVVDDGSGPQCTLIGTHVGIRSLIAAFPDVSNSVETLTVRASEETLREIVYRGAAEAQVEVNGADALVSLVVGSTQIMQLACNMWFRSLLRAGNLPPQTILDTEQIQQMLLQRFEQQSKWIERFVSEAGKDAAQRGAAVALLWAIGQSKDANVRRDKLPAAVPWEQRADEMEQIFAASLSAELPFRIDHGVLSVEDLRTVFLLRNWSTQDWSELASRLGAEVWFRPGTQAPSFPPHDDGQMEARFGDWSQQREKILRGLRCKDFHPQVYLLGSTERRVTFYAQQCRALSLVHALLDSGELEEGSRLGIVGGGLSGMTAAVAAARMGCQVTLYEKTGTLMPRQAAATHRYVHPSLYDSLTFPKHAGSGLPILHWNAAPAHEVVKQIRDGWDEEMKTLSPRLKFKKNQHVIGLQKKENGEILVITDEGRSPSFPVVIVAIGFGPEKVKLDGKCIAEADGYWEADKLSSEELVGSILVSGAGDGGLLDLARAAIVGFNHEAMLNWILNTDALAPLRQFAREQERNLDNEQLYEAYTDVVDRLPDLSNIFKSLPSPMRLRTGVQITFLYKDSPYDKYATSPVNRMITSLLLGLRNHAGDPLITQNSHGLQGFDDGKARMKVRGHVNDHSFDHVIIRHGPDHDYVWRSIDVLQADVERMRKNISELELTRDIHPDTLKFFKP